MRRKHRYIVAVLLALAFGAAAGYLYRVWEAPNIEERAHDTFENLKRGVEKFRK